MAKIDNRKLGIGVVLGITGVLIAGGLFGLIKSSLNPAEPVHMTAGLNEQSPMAGDLDNSSEVDKKPACDFNAWVGMYSGDAEKEAKATGRPVRLLGPGARFTMDYVPARINLEVDAEDKVTKIRCG